MALSVNTNAGAMVALQNLNKTNSEMNQVQNRINTGLEVSSAKDNGGIYAIAQRMRSQVAGYNAVSNSLDLATSVTDVALAAGEAISDILVEMKEKALAEDPSIETLTRWCQARESGKEDAHQLKGANQVKKVRTTKEDADVNKMRTAGRFSGRHNRNTRKRIAVHIRREKEGCNSGRGKVDSRAPIRENAHGTR